jgi:hypothetical protein
MLILFSIYNTQVLMEHPGKVFGESDEVVFFVRAGLCPALQAWAAFFAAQRLGTGCAGLRDDK